MDGQDHTSKTLLALSCVEELSLKKKTVLLDTIDVDEIGTEDAKDIVFKILGDDHATDFYKKLQSVDDIVEDLKKRDVHYITCYDDEYPEQLAEVYDRPLLLFVKGNVSTLKKRCISVVGTRRPTRYGAKVAEEFSREFAKAGLCIVSGFARGIDSIAHKACVENGCETVAVFACGLDVVYPAEHRGLMDSVLANGGAIVSEYPMGTKPLQYHFPERNRIVSGLGEAVFLPQAATKSGSLITIRLAIEQGKDIFIVPSNIYDEESAGNNELLREMPHALVIKPEDVLDAMHISREVVEKKTIELDFTQNQILEYLKDEERHVEDLIELTGLNVSELTSVLFDLEIEGLIVKTAGNYYALA